MDISKIKNLLAALFLLVIFQSFTGAQTNAANAARTVTDFYLQLPMIMVNDSATAAERRARIEIEDAANGYLKLKPGAEQDAREYTEIALFKKTSGGYVVAVNSLGCAENCLSTVRFLERRADRWIDVGSRVYRIAPETDLAQYRAKKTAAHRDYADENGFWTRTDLPREGRTVRVKYTGEGAAKEFELFSATWNGERFAPDESVKEIAPVVISDKISAAAEAAWQPFFQKIKIAVKTRDRKTLRALMSADFSYNCCDESYPDNRSGAFTTWDGVEKDYSGWKDLDRVLQTETMVESVLENRPRRSFDDAFFEFGANGKWIFTGYGASRGL